ncbi:MAG: hypothetical protein ABJO27_08800, partial [Pseudoruegeria sp.]
PLHGSTRFFALAAIFALRARAAQKTNSRCGLVPAVRGKMHQLPLCGTKLAFVAFAPKSASGNCRLLGVTSQAGILIRS